MTAVGAGDFDVIELKDGRKILLTGTTEERAAGTHQRNQTEL